MTVFGLRFKLYTLYSDPVVTSGVVFKAVGVNRCYAFFVRCVRNEHMGLMGGF